VNAQLARLRAHGESGLEHPALDETVVREPACKNGGECRDHTSEDVDDFLESQTLAVDYRATPLAPRRLLLNDAEVVTDVAFWP